MRNNSRILLASTKEAKLFSFNIGEGFRLIDQFDNSSYENEVKFTDSPGHNFKRKGAGGYLLDKDQSQKDDLRHHFALHINDCLFEDWEDSHFENLYLFAESKTLGEIRKSLSKQLKELVVSEMAMNLVSLDEHEIIEHLKKLTIN